MNVDPVLVAVETLGSDLDVSLREAAGAPVHYVIIAVHDGHRYISTNSPNATLKNIASELAHAANSLAN